MRFVSVSRILPLLLSSLCHASDIHAEHDKRQPAEAYAQLHGQLVELQDKQARFHEWLNRGKPPGGPERVRWSLFISGAVAHATSILGLAGAALETFASCEKLRWEMLRAMRDWRSLEAQAAEFLFALSTHGSPLNCEHGLGALPVGEVPLREFQVVLYWLERCDDIFRMLVDAMDAPISCTALPKTPLSSQCGHDGGPFGEHEVARRTLFGRWYTDQGLLRAVVRHVVSHGETVADIGAGGGHYAAWLNRTGLVEAFAFDGARGIETATGGAVRWADAGRPGLWLNRTFDWVFSVEVGEHLPPQRAPDFVRNLVRHASRGLVLSWSGDCSQGIGHIGCQPLQTWREMIASAGARMDETLTQLLASSADIPYISDSVTVFRKL